jgi:hypothetical protein
VITLAASVGVRRRAALIAVIPLVTAAAMACGKKGPPLAPLRLVPGPVSEVSVRRTGNDVQFRFTLPTANLNGPGRIDLDRVEIYAMTIGKGLGAPANRDLLTKAHLVGTITVKPPAPADEEPKPDAPPDPRPAPGDQVSFVEPLTDAKLKPEPQPVVPSKGSTKPAEGADRPAPAGELPPAAGAETQQLPPGPPPTGAVPPAGATPPAAAVSPTGTAPSSGRGAGAATPPAAAPAPLPYDVRMYSIRGVSRAGRPGQPSARLVVPLVEPPAVPTHVATTVTEGAIVIAWTPPVADVGGPPIAFNVYRAKGEGPALTATPTSNPQFEVSGVEFGTEQCFVVRAAQTIDTVTVEGAASDPACVTPRDTFPPKPPQGLSVLLLEGAIELVWDANTEADLAGYMVLRGDAPGDTLRPLTPSPIRETTFRDTAVTSGTRYVYAVVAVDRAGNAGTPSARVEGTAR